MSKQLIVEFGDDSNRPVKLIKKIDDSMAQMSDIELEFGETYY